MIVKRKSVHPLFEYRLRLLILVDTLCTVTSSAPSALASIPRSASSTTALIARPPVLSPPRSSQVQLVQSKLSPPMMSLSEVWRRSPPSIASRLAEVVVTRRLVR